MTKKHWCKNPKCGSKSKVELVHLDMEDTLTHKRYVCPACGAVFNVATVFDTAAKLAPPVIAGGVLCGLVTSLADLMDQGADAVVDVI